MKGKENKVLPVANHLHKKDVYNSLLTKISKIIVQGRTKAVQAIDLIQVRTYWNIGRMIVEHEQGGKARAGYGVALIPRLSEDMIKRFGRGFSGINLRNMRRFYLEFGTKIQQTVSDEFEPRLSWSHYCELLKEDNLASRSFYEIEAAENGWSMRELRRLFPQKKNFTAC